MTQTLAIFLDAYRDLNSRKLFWLAIGVSMLVVVIVGALGIDETGVSVLAFHFDSIMSMEPLAISSGTTLAVEMSARMAASHVSQMLIPSYWKIIL